jgi:polyisoprenoid-binding protein YceI
MKFSSLFLTLSLVLFPACQKSELTDKPAAEVTESSVTTAPATTDTAATTPAGNTVTANVLKDKSSINFVGAKVTRDHKGKFNNFDGMITYAGSTPQAVKFDIDLNSIETDTPDLTKHLKSPDFFDVAKYPKATFTSSSLTQAAAGAANGATHELKGMLDMHGVQKEVTIPVTATTTPEGVRTQSEFTIDRHDWGISYKGMADDLIKDKVLIKLDLLFPPPPAS